MPLISPLSLIRNPKVEGEHPPSLQDAQHAVRAASEAVVHCVEQWADSDQDVAFRDVECQVRDLVFAFAQAVVVLFLVLRETRLMRRYPAGRRLELQGRWFLRAPAIARNLTTLFGVVRYWRSYMREVGATGGRCGFHPLDASLGLPADRFSWNVLATSAWLATKLSFAEARSTLAEFVPNTPSVEVIEKTVLGFGHYAEPWLENREAPKDDGEVLIIMFDGKGIPTATEEELRRRRGRRRRPPETSPRHRGRIKRRRHPKKPRRTKGDKSKNAKMATAVVMYTLRRKGTRRLEGPLNKWIYSSLAPKHHAFAMARRWADARGFPEGSGKLVQILTDGDNDLARLSAEYFPSAEHTIDVWHVVEYLWTAGECLFPEGSRRLKAWAAKQKSRLFKSNVAAVLRELERRLAQLPKTGPGNKGRRKRLAGATRYIARRAAQMDYGRLRRRDLEISTGPVEGAIKHVIGRRQDHGGMRWVKERAEAVLKLRCIEVTGAWGAFERDIHDALQWNARTSGFRIRLQADQPATLPHIDTAA